MEENARSGTIEQEKAAIEAEIEEIDRELEKLKGNNVVCDRGKARPVKKADFHLDQAKLVEVKEPEWLIPGYVPKYGITTIAGEGGVGKTSLWCSIVASITTGKQHFLVQGQQIPFESEPETVVVFSAEDSWEYVLKRRLEANGADMDRVLYMEVKELDELAAANGISKNALKNAKTALNKEGKIHTWQIGYKDDKKYLVSLQPVKNPTRDQ